MLVSEKKHLLPAQQFAREFWVNMNNTINLPHYFYANMQEWVDQSKTFHTSDRFKDALEKFVQDNLDLPTTFEDIISEYDNTKNEDLRFWSGTYFMFNDTGEYDILSVEIGEDETPVVKFKCKKMTVSSFENAVVTFEGEGVWARLNFSLQEDMEDNEFSKRLDGKQVFFPRCSGQITREKQSYTVIGKKFCYSKEGAQHDTQGDSLDFWNGCYSLVELTAQGGKLWDRELSLIAEDSDPGHIFLQLGDTTLKVNQFSFYNNLLELNSDEGADISGRFFFERVYSGEKNFYADLSIDGAEKKFAGYLTSAVRHKRKKMGSVTAFATDTDAGPLSIITDRLPDTRADTTVQLQLKAEGRDPLQYVWEMIEMSAELSELSDLKFDNDGFISILLKDIAVGDYNFKVKLTCGDDFVVKRLTLRVNPADIDIIANDWDKTVTIATAVGVVITGVAALILHIKKRMDEKKLKKDPIKWEKDNVDVNNTLSDAKVAFEKNYTKGFGTLNEDVEVTVDNMKKEKAEYANHKGESDIIDNIISESFSKAKASLEGAIKEKNKEIGNLEKELGNEKLSEKKADELNGRIKELKNEIASSEQQKEGLDERTEAHKKASEGRRKVNEIEIK